MVEIVVFEGVGGSLWTQNFRENGASPTNDCWRQKTRFPGLLCGVVCVILGLAILVAHRLVTDRRTDRQTHADGKYRDSIASHG